MTPLIIILLYPLAGYFFTRWFHKFVLEGDDWADGPFDAGSAVIVTIFWPFMLLIVVLMYVIDALSDVGSFFTPFVRKIYRLNKDD